MIVPFKKTMPKVHPEAFIAPSASVIGRVNVAKGANIWYGAVVRGDINRIEIGSGTNVQDNAVLHVERDKPCLVKSGVTIGHQATVHACTVHEGALIGIGARVLNGAVVGRYTLVGAGSLVLEGTELPPYSLAVGSPCRVIRRLTPKEIQALKESARNYQALAKEYRNNTLPHTLLHPASMTPLNDLSDVF